jgi:hypothetical protein
LFVFSEDQDLGAKKATKYLQPSIYPSWAEKERPVSQINGKVRKYGRHLLPLRRGVDIGRIDSACTGLVDHCHI